ncbi:uncharacterized protein LOC113461643 isoform X3 [Phoenix dactylifera]|uniref:Uncharacterized protein LOC113461643 isoform X3 n=1 Tax=Phoenix dactylifera TaxID=42345 RepID=A0A8B9AVV5_PHODC|nr:uncharacterized protein LOC113461643 isoform X3 [Phoenix dactylifera]
MALFCVLAFLQVLALTAIASVKSGGRHGSDEVNRAEDVEGQPAKGAEAEINPTTRQSCHEQHHHLQAEKSSGTEDEHPTPCMLQNMREEASQYHDDTGNNKFDQVLQTDLSPATTVRDVPEPAENNRDGQREVGEAEEEMKSTSKFSYFSTGISVAGIISIFSGYLGDQTGHAHTVPLKVCTLFMLATFVSGASMLLLTFLHLSSRISIKFFRSLKYTTLGFLTLSMFSVSILFLKMFTILAFVPALFIAMISFIMAWHPCSHHQGNRGMSFRRLSESV